MFLSARTPQGSVATDAAPRPSTPPEMVELEVSSSDEAAEIMAPSTRGVLARLSFITRPRARAGEGTSATVGVIVASQISGYFVSGWLLVHTDHVLILIALLVQAMLTLKVVRDGVYAWASGQRLGIDRWSTVVIYALDFIFHITFFSASTIAVHTVMASALFAAGEGHAVAYLSALVVALVQILLFIGHASIGTLAHADAWVERDSS